MRTSPLNRGFKGGDDRTPIADPLLARRRGFTDVSSCISDDPSSGFVRGGLRCTGANREQNWASVGDAQPELPSAEKRIHAS